MGTQRDIAKQIISAKADYVLALKGNHPTLHQDVRAYFDAVTTPPAGWPESVGYTEATDGGHGRVEVRRCWASSDVSWLEQRMQWSGLRTIARVEAERHVGESVTRSRRYYVSSLVADAPRLLEASRVHWQIENAQHWVLDVVYGEDASRVRVGHAAQNLATLRRWSLNVLRQDGRRDTLRGKRKRAGWDEGYLARLLDIQMR